MEEASSPYLPIRFSRKKKGRPAEREGKQVGLKAVYSISPCQREGKEREDYCRWWWMVTTALQMGSNHSSVGSDSDRGSGSENELKKWL
ncbi:hypothetical protein Scep_000144 [Stephania cephalantha]|uniref:Uncharacterized protein n=1 Tax=Stephania cephalantha TaxID=152367 RepID=A0AAP0L5K4_9MAGN